MQAGRGHAEALERVCAEGGDGDGDGYESSSSEGEVDGHWGGGLHRE